MRVSVVTPSFNQGRTIAATIDSVLSQSHRDFEYVVVDGGSTDETLDVLRRYEGLRWVSEPDRGQTHAINKGLEMTSGEIVAYLNSDDVYRPGALEAAVEEFERNPSSVAAAGDCEILGEDGEVKGVFRARLSDPADLLRYWLWDRGVCLPQPAVFVRRSALDRIGRFDESFDMAMDLEMWQRLALLGPIATIPKTLAAYRDAPDNKTNTRHADMVWDCYRASCKHLALAQPGRRGAVRRELRRETAGHLLTIAEQERPANVRALALRALGCRPLIATSPRIWRILLGR